MKTAWANLCAEWNAKLHTCCLTLFVTVIGITVLDTRSAEAIDVLADLERSLFGDVNGSIDPAAVSGIPADGRALSFDISFSEMKSVEASVKDGAYLVAGLFLQYDEAINTDATVAPATSFLSDKNGSPLATPSLAEYDDMDQLYRLEFFPVDLAANPIMFHDVHFDITLPTSADPLSPAVTAGAALNLFIAGTLAAIAESQITIVPEPATASLLFLLAAVELFACRHRVPPPSR